MEKFPTAKLGESPGNAEDLTAQLRARRLGIVAIAAVIGVALSVMAYLAAASWQHRLFELKLADAAHNHHQTITADLSYATKHIDTLRALLDSSDHQVSRDEYLAFSSSLRKQIVGLRATAYAMRVTRGERDAFERQMRQNGFPTFEIKERDADGRAIRAGDRAAYFPIIYRDPADGLGRVLGHDVGGDTLSHVGANGNPDALPPVMVVPIRLQSDPTHPAGFMGFIPVYGKPGSAAAADHTPQGFVFGTFEFGTTIENILAEKTRPAGLDIYFYDPRKPAQDQLIYWHSSRTRPVPTPAPTQADLLSGPHWSDVLKVGDREFGAIYVPTEMFGLGEEKWQPPVALLVGLVITAMIVFYLLLSMRRTGQLEFLTASLRQMTRELRDEAEKVTHMAHHDAMTGLANRASFNAELERTFAAARRGAACFAVLCFDLDHFKDVNDTLGHAHGDLLLQAVAQRLRSIVRGGDLIGRLGGDEFAIIAGHSTPADEISKLAARVNESLATPFMLEGSEVRVSASIGIAFYSHSTGSPEEMMIKADLALYRSKETGRNRFCVHSADLDRDVQDRAALAGELRAAIEHNQIELLFQPQVDIRSRRVVGMEALARWNHPTRGLQLPAALTRAAEATGLMVPLGGWILEECCRQIERWRAEDIDVPRIAVNISAAELKAPDPDRDLGAILARHGIVPGDIEVEITEQGLIETTGHDNLIDGLRELGIAIAIDHFGTGCFSIARLRAVGVSRLKIAQEFTRDLCSKPADVAIVHATIGLARELGIEVIADGVETLEQMLFFTAAGCRYAQGDFFSRPVTAAVAADLMRIGAVGSSALLADPTNRERLAG